MLAIIHLHIGCPTTIWKNSDEEHATSGHFGGNTKCEQLEMFDFAVIADLTVLSGSLSVSGRSRLHTIVCTQCYLKARCCSKDP